MRDDFELHLHAPEVDAGEPAPRICESLDVLLDTVGIGAALTTIGAAR